MARRWRRPRTLSVVRLRPASHSGRKSGLPFRPGRTYVFVGEIPNMPGHCVVADMKTGRLFSCYHSDNFEEIVEDKA